MPAIKYKQKCYKCKTNYVTVTWKNKFPVCYQCQKSEMGATITDPEMKKMFNIPEEFYKDNSFLRSIKINYLKYGSLTDKQKEAFKNAVEKLKKSE
ncbi:hypothetical protein J4437_05625 [Candidatus Woesearchaeota archaeon]|nr:hypothetical protein [Candidatus Woesearchaeota archaeon]